MEQCVNWMVSTIKISVIIIVLKGSFDTWVESWVGDLGSWELKPSGHFETWVETETEILKAWSLSWFSWNGELRVERGDGDMTEPRGREGLSKWFTNDLGFSVLKVSLSWNGAFCTFFV